MMSLIQRTRCAKRARSRRGPAILAVVVLILLAPALAPAHASSNGATEDVWRLAGSFNLWNTSDDAWAMTALPDGTYAIQQRLPAGEYQFKFVKNGEWWAGHFGSAGDGNSLAEPGSNIVLQLDAEQPISIILDPARKTWRQGTLEVTTPIAIPRVIGLARVGRPVKIDLAQSLLPNGEQIIAIDVGDSEDIRTEGFGSEPHVLVTPTRTGIIELTITMRTSQAAAEPVKVRLNVIDPIFGLFPGDEDAFDFYPLSGPRWAAVFNAGSAGRVSTVKIHDRMRHKSVPVHVTPQEDGETFALIYNQATHFARGVPGPFRLEPANATETEFRLVEDPQVDWPLPIYHDPRRPDHFSSICTDLGLAEVNVFAYEGRLRDVTLVLHGGAQSMSVPMVAVPADIEGRVRWTARIQASNPNISYDIVPVFAAGNSTFVPFKFEGKIKPDFETPDWAKTAVWYQVFVERFRNGNSANDPVGIGTWLMPWTASWLEIMPGEFEAWQRRLRAFGVNPDQWDREKTGEAGGRYYNVVWDRRYGGDLQGLIERLDDLQDLGITALYLNPVFEASSMHKYDTTDFRHVDDNFGNTSEAPASWAQIPGERLDDESTWTWTEADLTMLRLIREVHRRDMRIIIDGVFNHVGRTHEAFRDVEAHGRDSIYADWFFAEFDDEGKLESWQAWDQPNGFLPKLRQNADGSLVEPVRKHIFDITTRWMDPNRDGDPSDGIDGWRLDVALDVGVPFWQAWCAHVRRINPDAYIVAEIWTDSESQGHLDGDQFDAQMHYPFADAVIDWLATEPGMTSAELASRLEAIFSNDAPQTQLAQQNLFESHDTDRFVSHIFNADRPNNNFDAGNRPQQNEPYDQSRPDDHAYALSRMAIALAATYPGAPMLYYGQEVGMYGADDPSNRKPYPWPEFTMDNPDDAADFELRAYYREWLTRRRDSRTLQLGLVRHIPTGREDVFAFERRLNNDRVIVIANRSGEPVSTEDVGVATDNDGATVIAPWSVRVLD